MSDLKRCPYCGGVPVWGIGCHIDNTPYAYRVECQKCKYVTPFYPTREEAIEAWNRRVDDHFLDATKMVERTAVLNNKVHLCEFCKYGYPECPAEMSDVIFGNGKGHDNVCACAKFEIKPERTAKVRPLEKRSETVMGWEGVCTNCGAYTIHEMDYCHNCGARLEWE